jgi:hypothetical protein
VGIYLLHPAWLAASAAIVLPVILHLWNDRRGKVLRIGSIQFLAGASRRMAWSRRLSQRWLLLVRCLLLLALAFLLAGPYWKGGAAGAGKGWVLDENGGNGPVGSRAAYRPLIDSLLKAGYERHVLDDSVNYWDGFRTADQAAPEGVPFYIFTTGLAQRFSGERPATEREVHWYTYAALDTAGHWIQRAWKVGRDSVRVLAGTSQPTGSFYHVENFAAGSAGVAGVTDTSVLRITVFTEPAYRQDGRYVAAAVRALQEFTGRRIEVQVTDRLPIGVVGAGAAGAGAAAGPDAGSADAGWLFWLALRPVPAGLGFAHVLCYEPGKTVNVDSWVEGVELMKEVQGEGTGLMAVWRDGYGRTILGKETSRGRYHFFSRFDPDWSGLCWSRSFPVLLASLLFSGDAPGPAMTADRRVLDPEQIAPVRGDAGAERQAAALRMLTAKVKTNDRAEMTMPPGGAIDLAPAAWLLITLLFILERVISYGKTKT